MRYKQLTVVLLCLCLGCIDPTSGDRRRVDPTPPSPSETSTKLEKLMYESLQKRDAVRAEKLKKLKGLKYDKNRQGAIEQAGAEAATQTWKPVADELSKRLDGIDQTDSASFDAVIDELARGSERASK